MAGAHRAAVPGVTLRTYIESRLNEMDRRFEAGLAAQDKAVQIAMIASEKAVVKAEVAAEKRFEATNEFRGQLADQALTFMPRVEAEQRIGALAEKLDDMKGSSKGGIRDAMAWLAAFGGLAVAVVSIITR